MGVASASKAAWQSVGKRTATYLANPDPLASAANSGAFIVWGNQPFYPLYVFLLVGRDGWPSLLTWFSTPFFFWVPLLARRNSLAGRAMFILVGIANTLLTTKAFGLRSSVGWFLVPCLILAAGFFRTPEWRVAAPLCGLVVLALPVIGGLGAPLHEYTAAQYQSLSRLNVWSATVLSLYLIYAAIRARRTQS